MNMIMQIVLFGLCAVSALCGIFCAIIAIIKLAKGHKRLSKEEKARIKEENARKVLNDQIVKIQKQLTDLNNKKK